MAAGLDGKAKRNGSMQMGVADVGQGRASLGLCQGQGMGSGLRERRKTTDDGMVVLE